MSDAPSGSQHDRPSIAARRVSPWVQLRSVGQHPLIYQRMIGQAEPAAQPGDVVSVYDKQDALLGRALFNPRSQIALRMLSRGPAPIDDSFWTARLRDALALRERFGIGPHTDAMRLVHAEGDGLSGLIAERYADCLVLELFSLGMFQRAEKLAGLLAELLGPPTSLDRPQKAAPQWRICIRADERVQRLEGFTAPPPKSPGDVIIREHGVRYRVDVAAGHKTGFFCDQRDNRRMLAGLCNDATVLDLCCYTGGFALSAKGPGKAREVTAVDLDETAVALARDNANLNQARIDFVHADAFVYLRQMISNRRTFDVVVLDPPKLANAREELDEAIDKYYDLNTLAMQCVKPGGLLLTCSCSGLVSRDMFLDTLYRAVRRNDRQVQMVNFTGAGPDHPIAMNCPESGYLKAAWLRLM